MIVAFWLYFAIHLYFFFIFFLVYLFFFAFLVLMPSIYNFSGLLMGDMDECRGGWAWEGFFDECAFEV